MIRNWISILLIVVPVIKTLAQQKFEVFVSSNCTFITDQKQPQEIIIYNRIYNYVEPITIIENYKPKVGIDVGFNGRFGVHKKIFISTGATFSLKRFKRIDEVQMDITLNDNDVAIIVGGPIGGIYGTGGGIYNSGLTINPSYKTTDEKIGETNTLYAIIPVNIGYKLNSKFSLEGGINVSFLMLSSVYEGENNWNHSTNGFTDIMASASSRASYYFLRNWAAYVGFQYSLSPIFESNKRAAGKAKFNTLSVGVAFQFNNKNQ